MFPYGTSPTTATASASDMSIEIRTTTENIDWQAVSELLKSVHLSQLDAEAQRRVFENSGVVSFLYDENRLIGCGRALTDGIAQAAVYNIALAEEYRGRGLGRKLIESILEQVKGCVVILYTHPQTIAMYEKFGFRRQKTGMVIFPGGQERIDVMDGMGFLLPEGHRFNDNEYDC